MSIEIPSQTSDLRAVQSVVLQAFNLNSAHWHKLSTDVGEKNFRILRSGGDIVGALALFESAQWFGGRSIPSVGVSCVATALPHRGKGHGRRMLSSLIDELRERDVHLCTLYPSTDAFYHKLGWGHAGSRVERVLAQIPISNTRSGLTICELDPTQPVDFQEIQRLHLERAARTCGAFSRSHGLWSRVFRRANASVRVYGIGKRDQLEGYVCAAQLQGSPHPLLFSDIVALSPAATQAIWEIASMHRPTVGELRWLGSDRDPSTLHLANDAWKIRHRCSWMLRPIHLVRALEERGYAPGVRGELSLDIHDPLVADNCGLFTIQVEDGRAQIRRGGSGSIRLGIQALGTLYSGFLSATDLSRIGQLNGDQRSIETANLMFSGPDPYCTDTF